MFEAHGIPSPAAAPPHRVVTCVALVLGAAVAIAVATTRPTLAHDSDHRHQWPMIGHDVNNSRSQPGESRIGRRNVSRLAPRWVLTTAGDVSATPAVGRAFGGGWEDEDESTLDSQLSTLNGRRDWGSRGLAVFFPDWGGRLWKVDAESGQVLWSKPISSYNGIPDSLSRTSPVLRARNGHRRRSERQHDGASTPRPGICAGSPSSIRIPAPSSRRRRSFTATACTSATSSNETSLPGTMPGYVCCTFRGSMLALDVDTGRIVWQTLRAARQRRPAGWLRRRRVRQPARNRSETWPGLWRRRAALHAARERHRLPRGRTRGLERGVLPRRRLLQLGRRLRPPHRAQPRWSFRGAGPMPGSSRAAASRRP